MPQIMELEGIDNGTFMKDGVEHKYARIRGRDLEGKFVRATSYDAVSDTLLNMVEKSLNPGEDVTGKRLMLSLNGEWKERVNEGYPRPQRYFLIHSFELMNGPSVVLNRAIKDGTVALRSAGNLLNGGNIKEAYQALEGFVAQLTSQPAPSLDHDDIFDPALVENEEISELPGENPEDQAIKKLEAYDARHTSPETVPAEDKVFGGDAVTSEETDVPTETIEEEAASEAPAEEAKEEVAPVKETAKKPSGFSRAGFTRPPVSPKKVESAKTESQPAKDETPAAPSRKPSVPRTGFGFGAR